MGILDIGFDSELGTAQAATGVPRNVGTDRRWSKTVAIHRGTPLHQTAFRFNKERKIFFVGIEHHIKRMIAHGISDQIPHADPMPNPNNPLYRAGHPVKDTTASPFLLDGAPPGRELNKEFSNEILKKFGDGIDEPHRRANPPGEPFLR